MKFDPSGPLKGTLRAPGDKSMSHRAALFGAMSADPVHVTGYLDAADTRSTLSAVHALGALVEEGAPGTLTIRGPGLRAAGDAHIDVGNAGTLMRLLPGWLAGQRGGEWTFDGDESIRRRPVDRIAKPLREMGAQIDATDDRLPPFTVRGTQLQGIEYALPVASAQIKSCVLMAGLLASGTTTVIEPEPSRDHTERLLARSGVKITRDGDRISLTQHDELELGAIHVPGDPSSAAFHIAAAVLVKGSRIVVTDMSANWTRVGFVRILQRMGGVVIGDLEAPVEGYINPQEPVTEVDVTSGPLVGTTVEPHEVPLAIDELPLVALLGCFAEGETVVTGAAELRVKESDRIATVVDGLTGLGADIEATEDGFVVRGTGGLRGGTIASHGDHRLAMLGAVAGLASREGVTVDGMEAAAVSYPGFENDLRTLLT
ncbi:3-phosphoshikimate 1-carboxyvinyltransferase [Solirubrobacter phytolaccae]|uniref:3-phosphoshikimate 1-carboxyvinyltransferase n=1 Tax=Solirubrobacter phytolaccae TaxID=1404360 RepID=A0A9X3NAP5_9ACTN|nr:3-phosphoshikimate 1-carboxyvinyltransferase [Solirubrobacter phytolaccae]MDA0182476.1 3-phosphoshikimate 1-carboxyvinyltransferase [Solirubrobacter phytolaccae]